MVLSDKRSLDIDSDPGCFRTTDPDVALCGSPNLDDTMAPDDTMALSDNAGHSDQDVPGDNTAFGCPPGHTLWPRPPPLPGIYVIFGGNMAHRPWL